MEVNWAPLLGKCQISDGELIFKGGLIEVAGQQVCAGGKFITDSEFAGGTITTEFEFAEIDQYTTCEIILYHNPASDYMLTAGLGGAGLYNIREFQNQWFLHGTVGDRSNLQRHKKYWMKVSLSGSRVTLTVDEVDVLSRNLPFQLTLGQVGLWCASLSYITVTDFDVRGEATKAFVVMQFSTLYNELYDDVIIPVCEDYRIKAIRVDEVCGPGLIIADIITQIIESQLIIAEITPENPNVYYEIGYAHALGKPTILIAEENTQLPFDLSPFRVLFYENSISGKKRIEEGLRKNLSAIVERSVS
ncbi:MAG: hypothetical protein ABII79_04480 [bacterium]